MIPSSSWRPRAAAARWWAVASAAAALACGPDHIEMDPPSVTLHGRGQKASVHAVPMSRSGSPLPDSTCKWSSSDEKVATVTARHNEATISAAGHGRAVVRCEAGGASAEVPVAVELVTRVEVEPRALQLRVLDEPLPSALAVRAYDGEGREVHGRAVLSRCLDENVCRGDARGQVWPVGPGDTRVLVEVDDGRGEAAVHVVDARSAAGRPRAVASNPMEHLDDPGPADRAGAGRRERRAPAGEPAPRGDAAHARGRGR